MSQFNTCVHFLNMHGYQLMITSRGSKHVANPVTISSRCVLIVVSLFFFLKPGIYKIFLVSIKSKLKTIKTQRYEIVTGSATCFDPLEVIISLISVHITEVYTLRIELRHMYGREIHYIWE